MQNGKLQFLVHVAILLGFGFGAFFWLDTKLDGIETALEDQWKGADMMLWNSETTARNPSLNLDLPDPYEIRRMRHEGSQ